MSEPSRSAGSWLPRRALPSLLIFALTACGSDPDAETESASLQARAREPGVRIVEPARGSVLSGDAAVQLEVVTLDSQSKLLFGVEGRALVDLDGPISQIRIPTKNFDDGEHALLARLTTADGNVFEDRVEVTFDNPDHRLLGLLPSASEYQRGQEVVLEAKYSSAGLGLSADFSQLDSGFSPNSVRVEDLGAGDYRVHYTISAGNTRTQGPHDVTLRAQNSAGEATLDTLALSYRAAPSLPLVVPNASYIDELPPALPASAAAAPLLQEATLSGPTLLAGGSLDLDVKYSVTADAVPDRLILSADGFSGQYAVPLPAMPPGSGEAHVELQLPAQQAELFTGPLRVRTALVSPRNLILDWLTVDIKTVIVSSNGVQVNLIWDKSADVDLSVITPAGNLLDFENPAVDGGTLDLDSNAMCMGDGTNAERISWKVGSELQGTYQVRVNLFDTCSQDNIRWQITAQYCGRSEVFTGTLSAANVDDTGTGQLVTEFTVDCNQVVRGKVQHDNIRDPASPGVIQLDDVKYARVRAISTDGATVFAESVTNNQGQFDMRWGDAALSDFIVEVEATYIHPLSNRATATVVPLGGGDAYRYRTAPFVGASTEVRDETIRITDADNAGAFNILDVLRRTKDWLLANVRGQGGTLPEVALAQWTNGSSTEIDNSFYRSGVLYINGNPDKPSHWNPPTIAHEFMHSVMDALSYDETPGGTHYLDGRYAPALAWSEGIASTLAQDVLGSSLRWVYYPGTNYGFDLETLEAALRNTSDGTTSGDVNEVLVGNVAWDLLDAKNDDPLAEHAAALNALFAAKPADRNGDKADLSDFLDQFRADNANALDAALKCVTDAVDYPYDYPDGVTCVP